MEGLASQRRSAIYNTNESVDVQKRHKECTHVRAGGECGEVRPAEHLVVGTWTPLPFPSIRHT